jgi:hypothetical protein
MRLIQFLTPTGDRRVGIVEASTAFELEGFSSMRQLALHAIATGKSLEDCATAARGSEGHAYDELLRNLRVLTPLDHDEVNRCLVSGTGLTHLGSAEARDRMHAKPAMSADEPATSDSLRMFRWGIDGGKPAPGQVGVQPEWFYKGDGSCLVAPGHSLCSPWFALDAGEEPEIVGLYVIGDDGAPYRLGFALGNDFSDHVTERKNYLYLAHSKLRCCSIGPELVTGPIPSRIQGTSRVRRGNATIWQRPFSSGEEHMCHSVANLEHHHFKYAAFRRPGDVHLHFLGTATLSYSDGIRTLDGDQFEIEAQGFGAPLVNPLRLEVRAPSPVQVRSL